MKSIMSLLLMSIILIASCATYPPSRIENGTYLCPKYEYSIDIPDEWQRVEKTPDWIGFSYVFKLMILNENSDGFIVINHNKSIFSLGLITLDSGYFLKASRKDIARQAKTFSKFKGFKNFESDLGVPYACYDTPCHFLKISFETDLFMANKEVAVFNCREDDMCEVIVLLFSKHANHKKNYAVYDKVLKSLKVRHDLVVKK